MQIEGKKGREGRREEMRGGKGERKGGKGGGEVLIMGERKRERHSQIYRRYI